VRYARAAEVAVITYVEGDLFDSPAQVLVNTVNTVGVMGKGIAQRFKRACPDMFRDYQALCEAGELKVGRLWLYRGPERWVLNFPTKKHWRTPSRPEYIEAGLQRFVEMYAEAGITQIAFPQLGCGNGELDWESEVRPLMEKYLSRLAIDVFVHLYPSADVPEHRDLAEMKRWLRLEVESLAFAEVWEDVVGAVREQRELTTLAGELPFRARIQSGDDDGVRLETTTGDLEVPRESVLEFWQQLRTYGYVTPWVLEANLESSFPYLVTIFAQLPYVRPVRLAHDPSQLGHTTALGLQWAPRVQSRDRPPVRDQQVVQLQLT
jgi:O-acetyl-ADP-ribose deacetylase (regulator of RNase III)